MLSRKPGPLAGAGVAITRSEGENGPLTALLRERGARVLDWGSIAFVPPEDASPLAEALGRLGRYDWICFSSPRAVAAVVGGMGLLPTGLLVAEGGGPGPSGRLRVAAVGPSTAQALRKEGWPVHRTPAEGGQGREGSGQALVDVFREAGDASGARVLFPASAIAGDVIPAGLAELGARVDRVTAYRMVTLPLDAERCKTLVDDGLVQVVTFASPSAMEGLKEGLGEGLFRRLAEELPAVAIGPTTAGALRGAGWKWVHVAREPTLEGLAAAADAALTKQDPGSAVQVEPGP